MRFIVGWCAPLAAAMLFGWLGEVLFNGNDAAEVTGIICGAVGAHLLKPWIWLRVAPLHPGFANFSAIAEQETKDGTYDQGLWSKALLVAHGDESQRKIAYMRLRATQMVASS